MPFDISNGLSLMGSTMAKTYGDEDLEKQKADLDMQKITLADQLAGVREHAGRVETAALTATENARHEGWQGGENELTRKAEMDRTLITERGANARNAASVGAAYAGLDLRRKELENTGVLRVGPDGAASRVNLYTGKSTPIIDDATKKQLVLSDPDAHVEMRTEAAVINAELDSLTTRMGKITDNTSPEYVRLNTQFDALTLAAEDFRKKLSATPGPVQNTGGPFGAGTIADPFRPRTQGDIDYFKQHATPAQHMLVDGKVYIGNSPLN